MHRDFYLELARSGLRMPIGTDLVLREQAEPGRILLDGRRLGCVVAAAAGRYRTPLAFPLMDLTLEKADLLGLIGVRGGETECFHFQEVPQSSVMERVCDTTAAPASPRIRANCEAVRYIATATDLVPVGMVIGPFSLMTKLLTDPIAPVALAGAGITGEENAEVRLAEGCLEMAVAAVLRSAKAQIDAGAKAMIVCEPAANIAYISPRQMHGGADIFSRFVLDPNRRLRKMLGESGVDLIFHNCGELRTEMVRRFAAELEPAILSLGSSRRLWEDAAVVPQNIVLFGNLPTKAFFSDTMMPLAEVVRRTIELKDRMAACGHPFILGSECDVLHVADAGDAIRSKVAAMLSA
ncbi:MAG TPA: uroporphyrinogen decarboxylase family protein [Bryobacteraceae bacterium]|nr:uroporphyrinogen decarboxylase family protein [Bryobacteraceae bacterium]